MNVSALPVADVGAALVTGISAGITAVLTLILATRLQRSTRAADRAKDREEALEAAAIEAARNLRVAMEVLERLVDARPPYRHTRRMAQCLAALADVRDDGVGIIASDDPGLRSQLFLAHDAVFLALKDAVAFLERAEELDLLGEPHHDEQAALMLDDAENAFRDYLEVLSLRINNDEPRVENREERDWDKWRTQRAALHTAPRNLPKG